VIDGIITMTMSHLKSNAFILVFLLVLAHNALSQKRHFQIQSLKTGKIVEVREGNFLQIIQKIDGTHDEFKFGKIQHISDDGIVLEQNILLGNSGGFVNYGDIKNIEKIKLVKRAVLPAIIGGYVIGQLLWIGQIPNEIAPVAGGAVSAFTLVWSMKRRKRSLYSNQINEEVILVRPQPKSTDYYFPSND
jgi:hypothetical protein